MIMKFDIIIIGGGMVGIAMGIALRNAHFSVAIIDASTPALNDPRLIALNDSSICLLKNLNLWEKLAPYSTPIQSVHVSHRGHFGAIHLTAEESHLSTLGYVIPARHINSALYESIDGITVIQPARLTQLIQSAQDVSITIETTASEKTYSASLLIGADGTYSTVRQLLNISTEEIDYHQLALVTETELHRSHNNIAYERFLNHGAIAMLPLQKNKVATIWSAKTDVIQQLMQTSDQDFLASLQEQFGYRLGRLKKTGHRATYPLRFIKANQHAKGRIILMGNALHTMHPIAAQGLNLSFYEIAALVDFLKNKNTLNDIDGADFQTAQQKISVQLSHHLNWLFSQDFFILNTARPIGMLGLELCQSLKKRFIQQALGRRGCIPTLLREQENESRSAIN